MIEWCKINGFKKGGVITIETAWLLAKSWYHNRLETLWKRKSIKESQELFNKMGMTSSFWKLK